MMSLNLPLLSNSLFVINVETAGLLIQNYMYIS